MVSGHLSCHVAEATVDRINYTANNSRKEDIFGTDNVAYYMLVESEEHPVFHDS